MHILLLGGSTLELDWESPKPSSVLRMGPGSGATPPLCLLQRANPFPTSLSLLAPDQVSTLAGAGGDF